MKSWSLTSTPPLHIHDTRTSLLPSALPCNDYEKQVWQLWTTTIRLVFLGERTIIYLTWTIGVLVFDSLQGLGIFLFTTASRTALGPTQSPIQLVPGALSLRVKLPGREADH
jgi:hypothetical protein